MPQGEQRVVGVFTVRDIVGPISVKGTFAGPKGVDEIKTRLADRINVRV